MEFTVVDERGRVTIGNKLVAKYGKQFIVVPTPEEILLVPTAEDPLAKLKELGKKLKIRNISATEITRLAEEEAYSEISAKIKRRTKK
ncbi:MAG: AbrB family transcriptional regulator [Candidatus Micrarchaeota archaeon]|nr:AbrB family transcriptional regulator [Candidatus Micrarchaeota archaeon]